MGIRQGKKKMSKTMETVQIENGCTGYYDIHGEKRLRLVRAGEILEFIRDLDHDRYLCGRVRVNHMRQTITDRIEIPHECATRIL